MTFEENARIERIKSAFKLVCEDMEHLTPELQKHAVVESIKDLIKDKSKDEVLRRYGQGPYFALDLIDLLSGSNAQMFYDTIRTMIKSEE